MLDLEIDSFTPCLLERSTGKLVETTYSIAGNSEITGLKKKGWLVSHYRDKFGAVLMGRPHEYLMIIDEEAAQYLLESYTIEASD